MAMVSPSPMGRISGSTSPGDTEEEEDGGAVSICLSLFSEDTAEVGAELATGSVATFDGVAFGDLDAAGKGGGRETLSPGVLSDATCGLLEEGIA